MAGAVREPGVPWLLADIGGTNARFALQTGAAAPSDIRVLDGDDFPDLAAAALDYLNRVGPMRPPRRAAMAVASPVTGDRVELTNRDWSFSISALKRRLGLDRLRVINDFTAVALAIPRLGGDDLRRIGGGESRPGCPVAVIGPGTGLGMSALIPDGERHIPLATEGGHATLAAADAREAEVIDRLRARFAHVSAERVLSGPGLVNLHAALAALAGAHTETLAPAEVTARALGGADPLCAEALAMFFAMLGTVAGNLALGLGARGGVYIAGGIVPGLVEAMEASSFRARFEDKGRFRDYMAAIPTHVVMHEQPAFLGLSALLDQDR